MIIEHSALLHAARMILKSANIDPDKEMSNPRGRGRDKPVGLDLLFGLHEAAGKSQESLKEPRQAAHSKSPEEVKADYQPPKKKPGRPRKEK